MYVSQNEEISSEDKLGFIMFECGLEGITLKVVKKSQFEHIECELTAETAHFDPAKSHDNSENSDSARSVYTTPKLTESKLPTKHESNHTPKLNEKDRKSKQEDEHVKHDLESEAKENAILAKDSGNVSSCIIEFKVVWFNFAAPPRAPITRKIDYTR
ncbi:hypothetical protein NQ314_000369 [Rhamnusium bicolor]|uniref:Bridge-like lipid transfer protein family member 1 middle region domain-containing protein n=1 Tax=Rhamnusium bicolor TaxID=1586634 RepID=A0AAV8ZW43_9CUCU|nr:hypothetical protein NQ314_000369 [Rhamnusium bicolor]